MLFRVIVSPEEIRRVTLESVPESVKELCEVLRSDLGLRGNFILQFQDPEFENELCNLTNIKDLPTDRATLKVLFTCSDSVSDSTLYTASISSSSSASVVEWPEPFVIPDFSHDVELQLCAANEAYAKDGTVLVISKGVKSEILDKLADMISKITPYPSRDHYESVATALVDKHPCLREPGSAKGWYCWVFSLKFKMGNYRQRLMAAGCPEVVVNKRKMGQTKSKAIKKSKKGEIHYLPDPPEGQSAVTSEEKRKIMLQEVQKREPNLQLLDELMTATFSQRRKEIIGDEPLISVVVERWPALFSERQVTKVNCRLYYVAFVWFYTLAVFNCCPAVLCLFQITAEFSRIVTTDLVQSFLDGLDVLLPSLLQLYKAAASSNRRLTLSSIMDSLQKEVCVKTNKNNIKKLCKNKLLHLLTFLHIIVCRTQIRTEEQLPCLVFHDSSQRILLR